MHAIAIHNEQEAKDMAVNLRIEQVYPNAYNVNRMDEGAYRRLVEDMKIGGPGSVDPISVRETKDGYEIVDGAHRYRAARELGWHTIRCVILRVSEDEAKRLNYRKNTERGTVDGEREGALFRDEHRRGLSYERIAKKYGVTSGHVSNRISIVERIPAEVRTRTPLTRVSASHLELIARVPRSDQQERLIREVADRGMSVRDLERRIGRLKHFVSKEKERKPVDCKLKILVDSWANAYAECAECKLQPPSQKR